MRMLVIVTGLFLVTSLEAQHFVEPGNDSLVLAMVDRDGEFSLLGLPPSGYQHPRMSPDSTRLAVQVSEEGGPESIWVYALSSPGNLAIQQLPQIGNSRRPIWTPDGERLAFSSDRDGTWSIYLQNADGTGEAELLTQAEEGVEHQPESWSPDGSVLTFSRHGAEFDDVSIWAVSPELDGEATLIVARAGGSALSPDGRWLAYHSADGGGYVQVFIQPFPVTGSVYRITHHGGSFPVWAPNGSELLYRRPSSSDPETDTPDVIAGVDIWTDGQVIAENEKTFPIEGLSSFSRYRDYDFTPEGEGFVVVLPSN